MSTFFKKLWDAEMKAWSVALRTAPLPFGVLLRRNDRHLSTRVSELCFGAHRPGVYPELSRSTIISGELFVTLRNLPGQSYNVTETELLAIGSIIKQMNARVAFEIGTADGRTIANMGDNMASQSTVFTLNLPLDEDPGHSQNVRVGDCFLRRPPAARVVQLWGDSKTFDFSPYWGSCGVVFIDGVHFEPGVSKDTRVAMQLVNRENGVILWHDALRFDVQKVLPKIAAAQALPIHLITNTNLACLFFSGGVAVDPVIWASACTRARNNSTAETGQVCHQ